MAVVDKCFANLAFSKQLVKSAPPPPVVIILLPLKLSIPTSPKHPQCFLSFSEIDIELPRASAASSTNGIFHCEQIFLISFIFAGIPKTCTGTIAAILLPVNLLKTLSPFRQAIYSNLFQVPKDRFQES